jgi:transcriptional regulator with XRE-family HTH domain
MGAQEGGAPMCLPGNPHRHAKAELVRAGRSYSDVAERLDCTRNWVQRVLNGHVPAPPRFRAAVAELTGLPEDRLFPEDELAGAR